MRLAGALCIALAALMFLTGTRCAAGRRVVSVEEQYYEDRRTLEEIEPEAE